MKKLIVTIFCSALAFGAFSQDILVQPSKKLASVAPTMWGIFFEDINMAADGGIYAELVKNRSFEFTNPLMGWKVQGPNAGTVLVNNRAEESPSNPRFVRVTHLTDAEFGLSNEGFRGIGVKAGEEYHFSVWARARSAMRLRIELKSPSGQVLASGSLPLQPAAATQRTVPDTTHSTPAAANTTPAKPGPAAASNTTQLTQAAIAASSPAQPASASDPAESASLRPSAFADPAWQKETVSFTATATELHAQLYIWFEGTGSADLDMISLFPQHTWKERPGGLRADLVQLLADMKPGFIRFPGGCIVEGRDLANRYQWKKTVGATEDRQVIINRWNTEFAHRLTPDYFQSYGLGFFEYFQLAEDIGASPLPILNCGMACQFNTAEVTPVDELQPYIQDALDLIEFANGATSTKWGRLREAMGHPAPFNLKMLGVGNEQWGPQYIERYTAFAQAIHSRWPDIRLVNSTGPNPDGPMFNFLNDTLRKMHADILDEHYYRAPDWFLKEARRYDNYDRKGPKIFAGEYAAQSNAIASPENSNNWQCALSEAAYMTGLERNADVVQMASYAPLFAHTEGWQWTPDLIWYDNLRSYGTPDYYVQKLYSTNKGTDVVPALLDGQSIAGQDSLFASAVVDKPSGELIIKIANVADKPQQKAIDLQDGRFVGNATLYTLTSPDLKAVNSLDNPKSLSPVVSSIKTENRRVNLTLPASSFTVVIIKLK